MRRFLPVCALAGCIAEDINDEDNCAETAAAGAAASALANDV